MRVALIRHPPAAIAPGLCYGRLDLPLRAPPDPRPVLAAMDGWTPRALWTSPATRCQAMAERLGAIWALARQPDTRLLELDFGAWEGMAWGAIDRTLLDRWAADPWGFAPPGGESGAELVARVRSFHAALRGDCAVVAHGGPLKVLAALLAGHDIDLLAPAQAMGSVVTIAPAG